MVRRNGISGNGGLIRRGSVTQWIMLGTFTWALLLTAAVLLSLPFTRKEFFLSIAGEFVAASVMAILIVPVFQRAADSFKDLRSHVVAIAGEHPSFPDAEEYFGKLGEARRQICILDTFSFLIEPARAESFRVAITRALRGNVHVRVLLVSPDSEAAAGRRRTLSDGRAGVSAAIFDRNLTTNLSTLFQLLTDQGSNGSAGKLEVRLYTVEPAVAYHRIDDTSLIAFYPIGVRAEDSPQLEVTLTSPFGKMVDQRFEEIWQSSDSTPLLDYYTCTVRLTDAGRDQSFKEIGFVSVSSHPFLATRELDLVSDLVNQPKVSIIWTKGDPETAYKVRHVRESDPEYAPARRAAVDKYGDHDQRYFALEPWS